MNETIYTEDHHRPLVNKYDSSPFLLNRNKTRAPCASTTAFVFAMVGVLGVCTTLTIALYKHDRYPSLTETSSHISDALAALVIAGLILALSTGSLTTVLFVMGLKASRTPIDFRSCFVSRASIHVCTGFTYLLFIFWCWLAAPLAIVTGFVSATPICTSQASILVDPAFYICKSIFSKRLLLQRSYFILYQSNPTSCLKRCWLGVKKSRTRNKATSARWAINRLWWPGICCCNQRVNPMSEQCFHSCRSVDFRLHAHC